MIVDVNVLLYSVNEDAENHEPVRSWLEGALDGDETVGLPWIVLLGFVRIATNPRVFSAPLSVDEALDRVEQWLDAHVVTVVTEKADHWPALRGLLDYTGNGREPDNRCAPRGVRHHPRRDAGVL